MAACSIFQETYRQRRTERKLKINRTAAITRHLILLLFSSPSKQAALNLALCCASLLILIGQAEASPFQGPIDVSIFPYYGMGKLHSLSIEKMNARLGNSPRLEQDLEFGDQDVYGVNFLVWTNRRKFGFGLGTWSSEAILRGRSAFEGVSGRATLSLLGVEGFFNYSLAAGKPTPMQLRRNWYQNLNLHLGFITGYSQISFTNVIKDRERNININYTYIGDRLSAGGRLLFTWDVYPWLTLILADVNFRQLISVGSNVSVRNYLISGRDEAALAPDSLTKEFKAAILMTAAAVGFELIF